MNEILLEKYDKKSIRSLIQLIPWGIGSSIDIYLKETINKIRHDRLREFFNELSNGDLEITDEIIGDEDFLHCYFSTIQAVLLTKRREKIKYFARLLNSTINYEKLKNSDEYEFYLKILDDLSLLEIEILITLRNYELNYPIGNEDIIHNRLRNNIKFWQEFTEEISKIFGIPNGEIIPTLIRIERTGCFYYPKLQANDLRLNSGTTTSLFRKLINIIGNK